ncbi:hypothetical protein BJ878DRAFT_430512, partial [Calycina marina]
VGLEIPKALHSSDSAYEIILSKRSLVKAQAALMSVETNFPRGPSNLSTIDVEDDGSIS